MRKERDQAVDKPVDKNPEILKEAMEPLTDEQILNANYCNINYKVPLAACYEITRMPAGLDKYGVIRLSAALKDNVSVPDLMKTYRKTHEEKK